MVLLIRPLWSLQLRHNISERQKDWCSHRPKKMRSHFCNDLPAWPLCCMAAEMLYGNVKVTRQGNTEVMQKWTSASSILVTDTMKIQKEYVGARCTGYKDTNGGKRTVILHIQASLQIGHRVQFSAIMKKYLVHMPYQQIGSCCSSQRELVHVEGLHKLPVHIFYWTDWKSSHKPMSHSSQNVKDVYRV